MKLSTGYPQVIHNLKCVLYCTFLYVNSYAKAYVKAYDKSYEMLYKNITIDLFIDTIWYQYITFLRLIICSLRT